MNNENKMRLSLILVLILFIITLFFEYIYFSNKLPFSIFAILIIILVLVIFEIYFRIQHNIDSKFNKINNMTNLQANFKRELFNVKNDIEYKLLNFKYDNIRKLDEINKKLDSLNKKSSKAR